MPSLAPVSNLQINFLVRLFIPFASGFFISVLYRTVTSVLAPHLIMEFNLSAADLGLITSSYFIAFALAQQPLGVALDRFGAKNTLSMLLLFAVVGSMIFSQANQIWQLAFGRGLIGIGVSGCLMAAFKAYNEWLPAEKLPLVNSFQTLIGGLGGIAAAQPVHLLLNYISWREVFFSLALATCIVSLAIYKAVPNKTSEQVQTKSICEQFAEILHIAGTGRFWRLAPAATMVQATYLALNTLWIGPWLKDVAGMTYSEAAAVLTLLSSAVCAGYFLNGAIAHRLGFYGISTEMVCLVGMAVFTISLGCIGVLANKASIYLWIIVMTAGPFSLLAYPIFIRMFDSALAGRVLTLYNFMVFFTSFLIQWFVGILINLWPSSNNGYHQQGYQNAILVLFFLNLAAILWMMFFRRQSFFFCLAGKREIGCSEKKL